MPFATRTRRAALAWKHPDMCQDLVARQLDDVNVLAEALVPALNENDDVRSKAIRVSMDRYVLAMGWSRDRCLSAIAAYAKEHAEFDDELFAPAFILKSIVPEDAKTSEILGAISDDVRALLTGILSCRSSLRTNR
jgi:hypothetical protein